MAERCEGQISLGFQCSRRGRIEHDGHFYCGHHVPKSALAPPEQVNPLTIVLCGCGCGEQVNPKYAVFLTAIWAGLTPREIAAYYDESVGWVRQLLAQPPRYLKGHWAKKAPIRELQAPWRAERAAAREAHAKKVREQHKLKASRIERQKAETKERQIKKHAYRDDGTKYESMFKSRWIYSFDAIMSHEPNAGAFSDVDLSDAGAGDPLSALLEAERRDEIQALIGTLDERKVAMLDGETLSWLQEKLRTAGFVPHGVQRCERENPQSHTGVSLIQSKGHGGSRRSRVAHRQVTLDHHVRELPHAAKRRDGQRRRFRQDLRREDKR